MTKRVLTALLSAAMLLSLLAGCGNSSSSASNAGEASAAPTESAKEEAKATDIGSTLDLSTPKEDSAEEEDPAEANDPSLHLYSYDSNYGVGAKTTGLPLTTEGDSFSLWLSVPGNVGTLFANGMADHPVFQKAEEFTGVHIDFLEQSAETNAEKFNLMLAGGDYPDLVNGMDYTGGNDLAVESDFAINLADDIAEYAPNYQNIINSDPSIIKTITTDEVIASYYNSAY